jgi:hypothetical protein
LGDGGAMQELPCCRLSDGHGRMQRFPQVKVSGMLACFPAQSC